MLSELVSQNGLNLEGIAWKGISVATHEHPVWPRTPCALVYCSHAMVLRDTLKCASCSLVLLVRSNSKALPYLSSKCSLMDCSLIGARERWSLLWEKGPSRPAGRVTGYHTADMNWCGGAVRSSTQKLFSDLVLCTSRSLLPASAHCCRGVRQDCSSWSPLGSCFSLALTTCTLIPWCGLEQAGAKQGDIRLGWAFQSDAGCTSTGCSRDEEAHGVCPVCSLCLSGPFIDLSVLLLWEIYLRTLWLVRCRKDKIGSYKKTKLAITQTLLPLPSTPRLDQYVLCVYSRSICKVKRGAICQTAWGRKASGLHLLVQNGRMLKILMSPQG